MWLRIGWTVLFLLLGPFIGGVLAGIDRKVTARLQGRKGPSVWQPFYDLFKLFRKQAVIVNSIQDFLICGFFVFIVFRFAPFQTGPRNPSGKKRFHNNQFFYNLPRAAPPYIFYHRSDQEPSGHPFPNHQSHSIP